MTTFLYDIKKFYKYLMYAIKSDLKSEVANSHLSWLWWILDPLMFMLVYVFIALIVFSKGEQYLPVFIFSGLSCWSFFENTVKNSVKLVTNNSAIVSKVYLPKYIFVFQKMGVNFFKMTIAFGIVLIMMILYRVPISWLVIWVIPILAGILLVTFGISTIMMHFGVFVEDLANVINIVMKVLFYMTGIFYSVVKRIPAPYNEILIRMNPMALFITDLRNVLLYQTSPHIPELLIWIGIGLVISVIGVKMIYKYENSYVKVI